MDASRYDNVVHKIYYDISDFEESAEPPVIKLESDTVDFGKIRFELHFTILDRSSWVHLQVQAASFPVIGISKSRKGAVQ